MATKTTKSKTTTAKAKTATKTRARKTPPKDGLFSGARWTDTAGASSIITDPKEIERLRKRNPGVF